MSTLHLYLLEILDLCLVQILSLIVLFCRKKLVKCITSKAAIFACFYSLWLSCIYIVYKQKMSPKEEVEVYEEVRNPVVMQF
jgi:hypothetical protein